MAEVGTHPEISRRDPSEQPMIEPCSRWFRFAFSLRTLFVVVTLVACWLGDEINAVKRRGALVKQFVAEGGQVMRRDQCGGLFRRWEDPPRISAWRQRLGDEPIGWLVCFSDDPAAAAADDLRRNFPEARVMIFPSDLR